MKWGISITKAAVLTAGVLFAFFCFVAGPNGQAAARVTGAGLAGPGEIYAAHCAKCHGADGRARTAKGKRSGATDFTSDWNTDEGRGIRIITNGKGEMPSFKGKLTAGDIRSVFGYVLRFRR